MIKKVSIQREPEPELNKAENAWKPSKLEGKPAGANSSEEEQTAVSVLRFQLTAASSTLCNVVRA